MSGELERLQLENAELRVELERLRASVGAQQPPAPQQAAAAAAGAPAANGGGAARPSWDGEQHGLDKGQIARYSRQIILHSFGVQGGQGGPAGTAVAHRLLGALSVGPGSPQAHPAPPFPPPPRCSASTAVPQLSADCGCGRAGLARRALPGGGGRGPPRAGGPRLCGAEQHPPPSHPQVDGRR